MGEEDHDDHYEYHVSEYDPYDLSDEDYHTMYNGFGYLNKEFLPIEEDETSSEPFVFCATPIAFKVQVMSVVSQLGTRPGENPLQWKTDFPDIVEKPIKFSEVMKIIPKNIHRKVTTEEKIIALDYLIEITEKYEEKDPEKNITTEWLKKNIKLPEEEMLTFEAIEKQCQEYVDRYIRQSEINIMAKFMFWYNDQEYKRIRMRKRREKKEFEKETKRIMKSMQKGSGKKDKKEKREKKEKKSKKKD